jgi:hypothetical protein
MSMMDAGVDGGMDAGEGGADAGGDATVNDGSVSDAGDTGAPDSPAD